MFNELGMFRKWRSGSAYAFVLTAFLVGCGGSEETNEEPDEMVYVDTKTGNAVVAEVSNETPALNPKTGRRTLVPGLYCSSCKSWHPVPSLEEINRLPGAAKCPQTGAALSLDGPWPE